MTVIDQSRIDAVLHSFQMLTPDRVTDSSHYHKQDTCFNGPFNEANRLENKREIFARTRWQVTDPRSVISERLGYEGAVRFLRRTLC